MAKYPERRKFKFERLKIVGFLRKNQVRLQALCPTEVLKSFVPLDENLRTRLTQSLLSTGWLRKDLDGSLVFIDADIRETLAVSEHTSKFNSSCPVCQKNYSKKDRISQNPFATIFGICKLCFTNTSLETMNSYSEALAKILVDASTKGILTHGRNTLISMNNDCDASLLNGICLLADHFAQRSDMVSAKEIRDCAISRLDAFQEKEKQKEQKRQERFIVLFDEINALMIDREYEIRDWALYGRAYVIKIWVEGYGTSFFEGSKLEIIRTLSNLVDLISESRFQCPACKREYTLDGTLRDLNFCFCETDLRFARLHSSSYEGANPYAAFDPWDWLISEIKARSPQVDELDTYLRALYSGVAVEELFEGSYVVDVPLSNFPCFAISRIVRPTPFADLSPEARYHVALSSLTSNIRCQIWRNYGTEHRAITYRLNGNDAYVDSTDCMVGICVIGMYDEEVIDWLDRRFAEIERDDLADWYHDGQWSLEEPKGGLTTFDRMSNGQYEEGWGVFIESATIDSIDTLREKVTQAMATLPDKLHALLNSLSQQVREIEIGRG